MNILNPRKEGNYKFVIKNKIKTQKEVKTMNRNQKPKTPTININDIKFNSPIDIFSHIYVIRDYVRIKYRYIDSFDKSLEKIITFNNLIEKLLEKFLTYLYFFGIRHKNHPIYVKFGGYIYKFNINEYKKYLKDYIKFIIDNVDYRLNFPAFIPYVEFLLKNSTINHDNTIQHDKIDVRKIKRNIKQIENEILEDIINDIDNEVMTDVQKYEYKNYNFENIENLLKLQQILNDINDLKFASEIDYRTLIDKYIELFKVLNEINPYNPYRRKIFEIVEFYMNENYLKDALLSKNSYTLFAFSELKNFAKSVVNSINSLTRIYHEDTKYYPFKNLPQLLGI
jgi:hypothetical protein